MQASFKAISRWPLMILGLLGCGSVRADYGLNFPQPAAGVAQEIYDIHMLTMQIATFLLILVFAFVFYSLYFHRKSRLTSISTKPGSATGPGSLSRRSCLALT